MKAYELIEWLNEHHPQKFAEDWDNVGLLVGDDQKEISHVFLALDLILMGWLGYPLDMMTATIMPMILGLAVDDTIHFINHGHLEFDRRGNYRDAILRSFRTIGTPIILTSVVICANFAIYMTSEGLSFIHMGLLSVAGIVSALVADLCVTPVLFQKFRLFGKEIETNETIN